MSDSSDKEETRQEEELKDTTDSMAKKEDQLPRKTSKGHPIYYLSDVKPPPGTKDPDTGKEVEDKDGAGLGEFY